MTPREQHLVFFVHTSLPIDIQSLCCAENVVFDLMRLVSEPLRLSGIFSERLASPTFFVTSMAIDFSTLALKESGMFASRE